MINFLLLPQYFEDIVYRTPIAVFVIQIYLSLSLFWIFDIGLSIQRYLEHIMLDDIRQYKSGDVIFQTYPKPCLKITSS